MDNTPNKKTAIESFVDTNKKFPHNVKTEEALLGTLLWNADHLHDVTDILDSEAFYAPRNKIIFQTMLNISNVGDAIDSVSLISKLEDSEQIDSIGGREYIKELIENSPSAANIQTYARIIQDKYVRRRLLEASSKITHISYDGKIKTEEVLDNAEKELFQITQHHSDARYKNISEVVPGLVNEIVNSSEDIDAHRGISTGFESVDSALSGLHKSDLIILAARPSVGKTAFALDIARRTSSKHGTSVGFLSLEMSTSQLVERLLAAESQLDAWKMRTGKIKEQEDFARLTDAADTLSSLSLYIDDRSSMSTLNIRSTARRMKREHNINLLVVDYLQLITPYESRKSESLVQHTTEVSHTLKQIARELEIPVIALSQLSRDIEKRSGKPRLSDLRDSGSIEQDADVVMFLHRNTDNLYEGEETAAIQTELLIEKHRNGPTGKVKLSFNKKKATFFEETSKAKYYDYKDEESIKNN